MKTALEIIRHTEQTDFHNGNNEAIISVYQIEEWMEHYAKQEREKAVMEFKEKLIIELPAPSKLDNEIKIDSNVKAKLDGYDLCLNTIKQLIQKHK